MLKNAHFKCGFNLEFNREIIINLNLIYIVKVQKISK